MIDRIIRLFPLWAVLMSAFSYYLPQYFTVLSPAIVPLLSIVMLGMGLTLKWSDFISILQSPLPVFIGVGLQFSIMPLSAYLIASYFDFSPEMIAGMVLLGAGAGAVASNLMTYVAKGNLALSITMTLVSTLCSLIFTPALTFLYAGQIVPVPFTGMLLSMVYMVVIPVIAGTTLNTVAGEKISALRHFFPLVSTFIVVLIIAVIFSLNSIMIFEAGFLILAAVIIQNFFGFALGYVIPWLMHYDRSICRTIAIEVSMQNSGLSAALAVKHFAAAAAVPAAIYSIWQNIAVSVISGIWGHSKD
jgi:BASS family bile acid:Na+ symporter